jgi:hypothetical protein
MEEAVRWNNRASKETEAVRWRVFHRTVEDIRERNSDTHPDELQRLIDQTVREVRSERNSKGKTGKA